MSALAKDRAQAEVYLQGAVTPREVTFRFDPRLAPKGTPEEVSHRLLTGALRQVRAAHNGSVQRVMDDLIADLRTVVPYDGSGRTTAAQDRELRDLLERMCERVVDVQVDALNARLGVLLATVLMPHLEGDTNA